MYKNQQTTGSERVENEVESLYTEGFCPYFLREKGRGVVYCECAKFRFPDKQSRRDIVYRFCAHPEQYKQCPIKQAMDHYYERKYARIEADVGEGA